MTNILKISDNALLAMQDVITKEEFEAIAFDARKSEEHITTMELIQSTSESQVSEVTPSVLTNWPVKLNLVPSNAPYLENANVFLMADCVAFAFADFHQKLLQDNVLLISCPKLDNGVQSLEKLIDILKTSWLKSLTIVRMEELCCNNLIRMSHTAAALAWKDIPIREIVISIHGKIIEPQ